MRVRLQVAGKCFQHAVGIVPHLDSPVLLGRDCLALAQLLQDHTNRTREDYAAEAEGLPGRITLEELMKGQKDDPSLKHAWDWVQGVEGVAKCPQRAFFVIKGGLFYRQDPGHTRTDLALCIY